MEADRILKCQFKIHVRSMFLLNKGEGGKGRRTMENERKERKLKGRKWKLRRRRRKGTKAMMRRGRQGATSYGEASDRGGGRGRGMNKDPERA